MRNLLWVFCVGGLFASSVAVRASQPAPAAEDWLAQWASAPPATPIDEALIDPEVQTDGLVEPKRSDILARQRVDTPAAQPTGALTGVVVYLAAGHGWTDSSSGWYLQRGETWDMIEDYGNLDQLNDLVQYAYNAGATVVPLRPVGHQPHEVILDNDDPGVQFLGTTWNDGDSPKYYENGVTTSGTVYRWTQAATTESAVARYTPTIPQPGFYPVYSFVVASGNRTRQTYRIVHSGGTSEITVDHRDVGNGWVWLGTYYFDAGTGQYVEITNFSDAGGAVIADAIRFGGGIGDVARYGAPSGYPRDAEAQCYWAEHTLGDEAVGFDNSIWDLSGYSDLSDNVGAGARWAREMNRVPDGGVQVDRWKRIYLELHTNATDQQSRGQMCLITTLGQTTYQTSFANTLSDEIDADLLLMDGAFEHEWFDRYYPTYTSAYGAIATSNNSNEFDATIVELAFHDNWQDAELLRNPEVRAAMSRACIHGIIRFLASLPDSEVPLVFPPDTPRNPRAAMMSDGRVQLAWDPPVADGAHGDAATSYVVYQSPNGYGFANPVHATGTNAVLADDLAPGELRYFKVVARNAGGESPGTDVLAVRRSTSGSANRTLVVAGFDRVDHYLSPWQTLTQPAGYAGTTFQRAIARDVNSFDYVVQHAEALATINVGFDSCSNEAARLALVSLPNYDRVIWMLGNESVRDATFDTIEQARVSTYLGDGGALFVSGSELAYDLVEIGNGVHFVTNTLHAQYLSDDAATYDVHPESGGLFADVGDFDFSPAHGAPYDVGYPDRYTPGTGATAGLSYAGGLGGSASVEFAGDGYATITFGFPFETITNTYARAALMADVVAFLTAMPFDSDWSGRIDVGDLDGFAEALTGPHVDHANEPHSRRMDGDGDGDIDLADMMLMQVNVSGS